MTRDLHVLGNALGNALVDIAKEGADMQVGTIFPGRGMT